MSGITVQTGGSEERGALRRAAPCLLRSLGFFLLTALPAVAGEAPAPPAAPSDAPPVILALDSAAGVAVVEAPAAAGGTPEPVLVRRGERLPGTTGRLLEVLPDRLVIDEPAGAGAGAGEEGQGEPVAERPTRRRRLWVYPPRAPGEPPRVLVAEPVRTPERRLEPAPPAVPDATPPAGARLRRLERPPGDDG